MENPETIDYLQSARDQLVSELEAMRQRLALLEMELSDAAGDLGPVLNPSKRREERRDYTGAVTVSIAADVAGKGVNLSPGGICLETNQAIVLRVTWVVDGQKRERQARLAWSRTPKEGPMQIGLEYLPDDPEGSR